MTTINILTLAYLATVVVSFTFLKLTPQLLTNAINSASKKTGLNDQAHSQVHAQKWHIAFSISMVMGWYVTWIITRIYIKIIINKLFKK